MLGRPGEGAQGPYQWWNDDFKVQTAEASREHHQDRER